MISAAIPPDSFWRSLRHLKQYRLYLGFVLVLGAWAFPDAPFISEVNARVFLNVSLLYAALALILAGLAHGGRLGFVDQLYAQIGVDILALTTLMALSGGNASGFGLLLVVPLAASGMLPDLRNVLTVAALASLAVITEQGIHVTLGAGDGIDGFMRAAALCVGLFSVALLSHALARSAATASQLAGEKTQLAEHLARINARVIQELPYGVLALDGDGQVVLANSRAEALLQGRFQRACPLLQCAPELAALWQDWSLENRIQPHPFQIDRDGPRLRARFIDLGADRGQGAIVVLEDMTELEAEAQKMKLAALGRLTANLAHEIRNPLAAINHAAELLKEERGDAVTQKLTRIIEDNSQRLNWLVDDVLSLNKRDRLNREALALAEVLAAFLDDFQRDHGIPAGIIQVEIEAQPLACFDRLHLQQILWNLCRNAWHYCRRQPGSIVLAARVRGERADLELFNDGPPISPDMRVRLFEPFYTTERTGTGLGLYISRELAEANDARLQYVDHPEGALFRLSCQAPPC